MAEKKISTAWMWSADGGVNGLKIDIDRRVLQWFDDIGCACGDATASQTIAHYREHGPAFPGTPDDVLAELDESLQEIEA